MESTITKIVLTGGPCAGKTTAMARIVEHFSGMGYLVLTVPEAATMFTQSGINFLTDDKVFFMECEKQLLEFQIELEERFSAIAAASHCPVLMICDRGTMDVSAYMENSVWQQLVDGMKTSVVEMRDARYDAVIHMTTAAKGAEKYYTLANNTARSESPEQAMEIDDRLMRAWTGHPHLRVVDNSTGFEEKIKRVLSEISHVLGVPQPIEIERKYLVDVTGDIPNSNVSEIEQTYLVPVDGKERRIRKRGENGNYIYFLTVKTPISDDRRIETECRIDEKEYLELLSEANSEKVTILKERCCFLWDSRYFELDSFINPVLEHKMLEIEDVEDHSQIKFPPFLRVIEDVTGNENYYNTNIAKRKKS